MKHIFFFTRTAILRSLLLLLLMGAIIETVMGEEIIHYANLTAKVATGAGKVYVTDTIKPLSTINFQDSIMLGYSDNRGEGADSTTVTIYAYAQPNEGYYLSSWDTDSLAEGTTVVAISDTMITVSGTSTEVIFGGVSFGTVFANFDPIVMVNGGTDAETPIQTTDLYGTATGTLAFSVGDANYADGRDFIISSDNEHFEVIDSTYADNVFTLTLRYQDRNHHGDRVDSAMVTLTSKGEGGGSATAKIYASSDLTPYFSLPTTLDFGAVMGDESKHDTITATLLSETARQDVPLSEGATGTKWEYSISGDNSANFAVTDTLTNGIYAVEFRPTDADSTYTATLTVTAYYTDGYANTVTYTQTTALIGASQKKDNPSALTHAEAKSNLRVCYVDHAWAITVSSAETLWLYNSVGNLVATWQQAANEQKIISAPAAGIYILRSEKKAILLKK